MHPVVWWPEGHPFARVFGVFGLGGKTPHQKFLLVPALLGTVFAAILFLSSGFPVDPHVRFQYLPKTYDPYQMVHPIPAMDLPGHRVEKHQVGQIQSGPGGPGILRFHFHFHQMTVPFLGVPPPRCPPHPLNAVLGWAFGSQIHPPTLGELILCPGWEPLLCGLYKLLNPQVVVANCHPGVPPGRLPAVCSEKDG